MRPENSGGLSPKEAIEQWEMSSVTILGKRLGSHLFGGAMHALIEKSEAWE
jgi:hypothetical protein